ncbi:hypothetical protein RRSWK_05958 [Rhodopirellula sp. SWK7]|nr:hypothetical protein RRSWK_05958 [Rhodopirellula sp. SWK7]
MRHLTSSPVTSNEVFHGYSPVELSAFQTHLHKSSSPRRTGEFNKSLNTPANQTPPILHDTLPLAS